MPYIERLTVHCSGVIIWTITIGGLDKMKLRKLSEFSSDCMVYNLKTFHQRRHKFTEYSSKRIPRETNIFLYVHYGRLRFECADNNVFIAEKDMIVYIPKGAYYISTYLEENTEITSVQFLMKDGDGDFVFSDTMEIMPSQYAMHYEPLFTAFHKFVGTEQMILGRMSKLFALFDAFLDSNYVKASDPRYKTIQPAINMLSDHFNENLSISQIAKAANISECYFRRIFKLFYGVSPVTYRNRLRLAYIDDLVKNDMCTISEAISSAGIDNTSYYYKMLKKSERVT